MAQLGDPRPPIEMIDPASSVVLATKLKKQKKRKE
jgi:hypothetical protein